MLQTFSLFHSEIFLFFFFFFAFFLHSLQLCTISILVHWCVCLCWGKALGGSVGIFTSPEGRWSAPKSSSSSVDQSQSSHSKDQISSCLLLSSIQQSKTAFIVLLCHIFCASKDDHTVTLASVCSIPHKLLQGATVCYQWWWKFTDLISVKTYLLFSHIFLAACSSSSWQTHCFDVPWSPTGMGTQRENSYVHMVKGMRGIQWWIIKTTSSWKEVNLYSVDLCV